MNYRNPALLRLARNMPCQLRISGVCNGDNSTTVAAHSNSQRHGKGMGIKAHDFATAHLCSACHQWLDSGPATREEKDAAFMEACLWTYATLLERGLLKVAA